MSTLKHGGQPVLVGVRVPLQKAQGRPKEVSSTLKASGECTHGAQRMKTWQAVPLEGKEWLGETCFEWLTSRVYAASSGGEGTDRKIIL